jgi:hypothetical protein
MDIPTAERRMWAIALFVYLGLDCFTTVLIQLRPESIEQARVALWFLDTFGLAGLALQKLAIGILLVSLGAVYIRVAASLTPGYWRYRLLLPGTIGLWGAWIVTWHIGTLLDLHGITPAVTQTIPDPDIIR